MACKGKRVCAKTIRAANPQVILVLLLWEWSRSLPIASHFSRSKDNELFKELILKFGLPDDE